VPKRKSRISANYTRCRSVENVEVSRAQWWLSKSSRSSTPKTGFDLTVLSSPNVSMYYRYQQP